MTLPSYSQQNIDAFLEAIQPVQDAYRNDTFSYLAVRNSDGFVLIQSTLFLDVGPRRFPAASFQSQNVRAAHYRLADLGISRSAFIECICTGKLETPDGDLLFPSNDSGSYGTMYVPFHAVGVQGQRRLSVLSIFGADRRQLIEQPSIDWELRAASTPYDGLQDVLHEYQLGVLRGISSVEIAAFNVAAIDASSMVRGEVASIVIRAAHGLTTSRITVGLRVLDQGRVIRRSQLAGDEFAWAVADGHQLGTAEFTVPRAAVIQCIANYNGIAQHYYWVGDPTAFQNPRRAAYEAFDLRLDSLKDIFAKAQGRGPDARNFESSISWLFWMLGFSPVHLGGAPRTQDAADIILCTPAGHFAVVECTTGLLRADNKLPILHDRALAVRRNLDASSAKHLRVLPVLVTSKTQEEVRPDMEQAEKLGIHVLTREGVERLAERTLLPLNADQLYEQAEQLVRVALERHEPARDLGFDFPDPATIQ